MFSLDDHEETMEKEPLEEKPADEGKPKSDITIMYLSIEASFFRFYTADCSSGTHLTFQYYHYITFVNIGRRLDEYYIHV